MALTQHLGDQADLAVLVNVVHRDVRKTRVGPQGRGQARREQRVAAQVREKIGTAHNRLAGKQRGQGRKQGFFRRRSWRVGAASLPAGHRQGTRLEAVAVDLAGGQARHFQEWLEVTGHHVGRQGVCQRGTQFGTGAAHAAFKNEEGDQLVDAAFLALDNGDGAHAGQLGQRRLDLAQLHPKAAYFHLVIGAAQAVHAAIGVDAGQIARAVQAVVMRMAAPGVGQEFLGRQVGPAQVTGRHPGAGDAQLADFPARQQHQAVFNGRVDHHQAVIGQRPPDGHGLARLQLGQAGRHGGFGRAIGIEHLAAGLGPARHQ